MGGCLSASEGDDKQGDSDDNGCKRCCLSTRKCLMSGECGRALQIANVCAMCGMCLRMFV